MVELDLGDLFQPEGLEIPALRIWNCEKGEVTGQGQQSGTAERGTSSPPSPATASPNSRNPRSLQEFLLPAWNPPSCPWHEGIPGNPEQRGAGGAQAVQPPPSLLFLAAQAGLSSMEQRQSPSVLPGWSPSHPRCSRRIPARLLQCRKLWSGFTSVQDPHLKEVNHGLERGFFTLLDAKGEG